MPRNTYKTLPDEIGWELARVNGLTYDSVYSRIMYYDYSLWDAITIKKKHRDYDNDIYEFTKGHTVLAFGTAAECAEQMDVELSTIKWYLSSYYQKKLKTVKDLDKRVTVTKLEGDELDE